jgi:transcriptional regulator with XRE-family HTH domain
MSKSSFRSELRKFRPDVAAAVKNSENKRKLALALRALRKDKGLTQKDIEKLSTLTQPAISRLESPTGPIPNLDTISRYVEACKGHMILGVSAHAFDEVAFVESQTHNGEPLVALAV